MSSVNITTNKNTVSVTESKISVGPTSGISRVVTVATQGPAGQAGTGGTVDVSAAVGNSLVYYDATSSSLKATSTWTTSTLTDGGNF
tara:strand:+ start:192 stop:452 length:261 start_codon:yes stop_codon:yes gene_type:complete